MTTDQDVRLPLCPLPAPALPRCLFTDLPRLLCGCAQHQRWNAELDYDDLEPAEHEYLAAREKHPAFLSLAATSTVRVIPEYRAQPWTQARNTPVVTTGTTCELCGKRPAGDAFVCPDCLDDLRVHLGDVPGLLDDLDVLARRESVVNTRPRLQRLAARTRWDHLLRADPKDRANPTVGQQLASAGYHRPLHVERAVVARDELANEVTTAVRAVTEARGIVPPSMDTRAASRWLLVHLSSVSVDPAAPDICRGIRKAHDRAMAAIDGEEDGIYIGLCDDPEQEPCLVRMYADPEEHEHRCTTCGATYDVSERREAIRDRVRESLLSIDEIAKASADVATFGKRLDEKQLRRWRDQGRLVRAGSKPHEGHDDIATYRAMDVVDLVATRTQR